MRLSRAVAIPVIYIFTYPRTRVLHTPPLCCTHILPLQNESKEKRATKKIRKQRKSNRKRESTIATDRGA